MTREPAVAGQFYPASRSSLETKLKELLDERAKREEALGVVSPHAGYMYSGPVAGALFSSVVIKKTALILGPNHTGLGAQFAIMTHGAWQMPLGKIEIEEELANTILNGSKFLEEDDNAHSDEHSIEVQLPFLQYLRNDIKLVPIILGHADVKTYNAIGDELADVIAKKRQDILIVASSDMTHYEPHDEAKAKDNKALDAILKLDPDTLMERVAKFNITMCGYAPVCALLACAKKLGAKSARLVRYQTSGDASGDYSSVVGYAGVAIYG